MLFYSTIFIIGEDSKNIRSRLGTGFYALVITGGLKLKLIFKSRKILQGLDVNIMFINEDIEMNAVVFD